MKKLLILLLIPTLALASYFPKSAGYYGEMGNVVGSSAPEAVPSADEWCAMFHANITGSAPHLNNGFTFVAGFDGAIASVADNGSGDARFTDVAHGLTDGDYITVQASVAGYTGIHLVDVITVDTFDVLGLTYTATATGTWQMGSYLLVGNTGIYRGAWNASFSQSTNNTQTSQVCPYINATISTKACASRLLANNTDIGSIGGNGLMNMTTGDRIWFAVQCTTPQTLTFTIRNVTLH